MVQEWEGKRGRGRSEKENTFTLFTIDNKAIQWMQNINNYVIIQGNMIRVVRFVKIAHDHNDFNSSQSF